MKFVALIVTFNRLEKLKKSIEASINAGFDSIFVIDNCSSDGTKEWLSAQNEMVLNCFFLDENKGGSGGFNYGLKKTVSVSENEWIFVFDDDAYVDINIISNFKNLQNEKKSQAYCSKVLDLQGKTCRMNVPFVRYPNGFLHSIRYLLSGDKYFCNLTSEQDVVSLSFVGAILHRDFISRNISHLKEDLFIYFDDLYFSYTANKNGERIIFSPELIIYHDVVTSKGVYPEWKVYYLVRNLILGTNVYKDNSPFGWVSVLFRVFKYFTLTLTQKNKIKYFQFFLKGISDGLAGKTGKLL